MKLELAVIGATALWLTYLWLASAIAASYLSGRKGYGEKLGLAFGLLLSLVGVLIWLALAGEEPTRAGSCRACSAAAARRWRSCAPSSTPSRARALRLLVSAS